MVGPVLGVAVTDDLKLCVKVFRTRKNLNFPAHPGPSDTHKVKGMHEVVLHAEVSCIVCTCVL